LHQNAIAALALNGRFHKAQFVDTLFNDGDRLVDGLPRALDHRGFGRGNANQPAAGIDHLEAAHAVALQYAAKRLRQVAQLVERCGEIRSFAQPHLDAVVAHRRRIGPGYPGFAQRSQHFVAQVVETLLANIVLVDFQQDMRTALKIEAEHKTTLSPCGPVFDGLLGKEIRYCKGANHQGGEQDCQGLCAREVQHVFPTNPPASACGALHIFHSNTMPGIAPSRLGSPTPGTWSKTRWVPWRWTVALTRPTPLIRASIMGIERSIVWRARSVISASVGVRRTRPSPASATSTERMPLNGCDSSRSFVNPAGKSPSLNQTSTLS